VTAAGGGVAVSDGAAEIAGSVAGTAAGAGVFFLGGFGFSWTGPNSMPCAGAGLSLAVANRATTAAAAIRGGAKRIPSIQVSIFAVTHAERYGGVKTSRCRGSR
jgi:hypothetical protein